MEVIKVNVVLRIDSQVTRAGTISVFVSQCIIPDLPNFLPRVALECKSCTVEHMIYNATVHMGIQAHFSPVSKPSLLSQCLGSESGDFVSVGILKVRK